MLFNAAHAMRICSIINIASEMRNEDKGARTIIVGGHRWFPK